VIAAAVCVALLATSAAPPTPGPAASGPAASEPAASGPATPQAAPPRVSYEDAEHKARSGDTLGALEAFQALAAANPDDFDSRVWLGRLLTRVGRRAEAIDLLRDVIARSPRQVDARVALGAALLTSGRVDDAFAVVQDAEALEPNSADVLALKGRVLRHLGRPSEAYIALDAAHALSPADQDVSIVRERTRRMIAHRAHVSVAQEASDDIAEASIVDADVDLHLDDTVRVFGRVQWQGRAGFDDARGGGGVEWRLSRRVVGRGALLISPGAPRLARADAGGEVEIAAGRTQTTIGLRYLDFAGARVWIVAPAISIDLNDVVTLAGRYYRSESEFRPFGRRAGNDSGAIIGRWQAARRLSLSAAYARGNESFDIVSVDRLGRFRADTVAGGARVDLRSLTSLGIGVEHQWRSGDRQLTRLTLDVVQHF
jgi:YaiO family outer membrane protein